jgi:hypothetical protein
MRRFIRLTALGLVLASVPCAAWAGEPILPAIPAFRTAANAAPPAFTVQAPLPAVPASLPVFRLAPLGSGQSYVQAVAGALGVAGEAGLDGLKWSVVQEGPAPLETRELTVFSPSGGFEYLLPERRYKFPSGAVDLPERSQAHQLALQLLQSSGLLPPGAVTDPNAAAFSELTFTKRDAALGADLETLRATLEVRFPQQWGAFRVTGPGSKLYVAFGHQGQVLGVTRMWRRAVDVQGTLASIPPAQALALLAQGHGRLAAPLGCSEARVSEVELLYWSESPRNVQVAGLPVYRVKGQCHAQGGTPLDTFEAYAPAVRAAD